MQKILLLIASLFYFNFILAENEIKSWQGIHETPLSSLEQQFAEPPVEFANHVIWGWEGKMDKKTICNDLDSIKKKGFRAVIFEAGYKLPFKYLSGTSRFENASSCDRRYHTNKTGRSNDKP